jgi:CHAT domain-containing protein/cytochrome c-type biogenesis protein CcmH/NrfG
MLLMVFKRNEPNTIRRYLLRQLSNSEQQALELRLLSDDELNEEFNRVEDELIDEYLDNELSNEERRKFEEIFLANAERKRQLEAGQALRRYLNTTHQTPSSSTGRVSSWFKDLRHSFLSPPITATITVFAIAVVGLIVWRAVFYQSDLEEGLAALNKAYHSERPVEARVSGIGYAPFLSTRGRQPEHINETERSEAQLLIQRALKQRSDAPAYHALGQFYLLQRDFDKAIEQLEQAQKLNGNNAQIYADLGAAYLEKGKRELELGQSGNNDVEAGKGVTDLGRSLENLQRSLELDPNLLSALFNRALVLQHQKLYREAEAAWRTYLEKDTTSQWANDAREYLRLLEEKNGNKSDSGDPPLKRFLQAYKTGDDDAAWEIYRRNHLSGGNLVTGELLNSALAEDSNEVREALKAIEYLGQLELRKVQDAYTSDLAKFYASLDPATPKLLLQARNEVEQGSALLLQSRVDEANKIFESALSTFRKVGDVPEALATEATIAHGATVQPNLAKGQEVLAHVIPECEARRYKWLLAETISERAHIQTNLNNYSEALDDSERALQLSQELQDTSGTLGKLSQLAGLYLFLNDNEMSFSYVSRALAVTEKDRARPMQIWGVHITTSVNLSAIQLHRAALVYQKEALQLALASRLPLYISRSYQFIGNSYGALGNFDLAFQNMHLAYEQGKPLASERNGQNMMANASLKLGDLYRASGDASSALKAYEESSRLYQTLGFDHYNYAAHKGKFLSYLVQNNDAMAAQELQTVLSLFDEYREKILGERQRSFFFDREQDTYDLAIDFAYSRLGNTSQAYTYSEACRARNLRELMNHGAKVTQSDSGLDLRSTNHSKSEDALSLAQVQEKMPAEVQIVEFAVLEKKLLIWYLTQSKMVTKTVEVKSTELAELVTTSLEQIIRRDQNGAAASLKELDRLLVEPIRGELDPNLVLCFIPDKSLHYVPFGALIFNMTGHYLAQDFRVMISPSASVLIESTKKARTKSSTRGEQLLAVGNPKFDRVINPSLSNLPGAEREVEGIASAYSSPRKLIGPQATRKSLLGELPRSDVVHFAAHYEIDPRSMLSSKLLLAPEAGERSHSQPATNLSSSDIYRMQLARTKLVVLSACSTGIEHQFKGEGPVGFARSFLVAGVPVVVASLWPVDSDATAELMIRFHRFRRVKHSSTTQALQKAQQEMISHDNPRYRNPFYWAGFVVIGGYADF